MSETWSIAIFTCIVGALGWIGVELHSIVKELREFVTRSECQNSMNNYCSEINAIREDVKQQGEEIAKLLAIYERKY